MVAASAVEGPPEQEIEMSESPEELDESFKWFDHQEEHQEAMALGLYCATCLDRGDQVIPDMEDDEY